MKALALVLLAACGRYEEAYVAQAIDLTMHAMDKAGVKTGQVRHVTFEAKAPASFDTGHVDLDGPRATIQMGEAYDPVLFHEIGHALGLVHVDDPKSIMNHHVPDTEMEDAIDQLVDACSKRLCWRLEMER